MNATMVVRLVSRPAITDAEYNLLEDGHPRCGEVRPGTLGYQRCWRRYEHDGAHVAQDSGAWIYETAAAEEEEGR